MTSRGVVILTALLLNVVKQVVTATGNASVYKRTYTHNL